MNSFQVLPQFTLVPICAWMILSVGTMYFKCFYRRSELGSQKHAFAYSGVIQRIQIRMRRKIWSNKPKTLHLNSSMYVCIISLYAWHGQARWEKYITLFGSINSIIFCITYNIRNWKIYTVLFLGNLGEQGWRITIYGRILLYVQYSPVCSSGVSRKSMILLNDDCGFLFQLRTWVLTINFEIRIYWCHNIPPNVLPCFHSSSVTVQRDQLWEPRLP